MIHIIGGGLAGCEAAWHLAEEGFSVKLWEMRPDHPTPVHQTGYLAELVCSNSLKSDQEYTGQGLLKREMRALGSILLQCAEIHKVSGGISSGC
jgi:methylenetetrahydrofolate--tRNA-(uracil-5-)-methyltransferase